MGLGLSTGGGGSRTPFISYDARAGRMFRVDRTQDAGGTWSSNKVDITNNCVFLADMQNIKVGWLAFTDQGPTKLLVPLGQPLPARPDGKKSDGKPLFSNGFQLMVLLSNTCGGAPAREFASSAGCVIEAMDSLHTTFAATPEAAEGKIPVIKMVGCAPVKSGQSTNYKPEFQIIAWKDRPLDLPVPSASPPPPAQHAQNGAQRSAPPATGSTVVAPPAAAQPAQQPAMADAHDFG